MPSLVKTVTSSLVLSTTTSATFLKSKIEAQAPEADAITTKLTEDLADQGVTFRVPAIDASLEQGAADAESEETSDKKAGLGVPGCEAAKYARYYMFACTGEKPLSDPYYLRMTAEIAGKKLDGTQEEAFSDWFTGFIRENKYEVCQKELGCEYAQKYKDLEGCNFYGQDVMGGEGEAGNACAGMDKERREA